MNKKQTSLTHFFKWTPSRVQKRVLPRCLETLISSFNKNTTKEDIEEGKQHTMTEYLSQSVENWEEYCYLVAVYQKKSF